MNPIRAGLGDLDAVFLRHDADERDFRAEIDAAGGLRAWWAAHADGELPENLDETHIALETAGFWRWAAERSKLCARCPAEGGRCDEPTEPLRGRRLQLADERPVAGKCERWPEHVLRGWALRSNVPPRLAGYSVDEFEFPDDDALDTIKLFLVESEERCTHWLVLRGPSHSGKTHLAIALLRERKRRRLAHSCWYIDLRLAAGDMKAFFTNPSSVEDPLDRVRRAPFVVIDNLDLRGAPNWLREAIEEALQIRYNAELPTVLTTHETKATMVKHLSRLSGFEKNEIAIELPEYR